MPEIETLWKEINYETKFVNLCAKEGWLCEKFIVPGKRGVPDRLVTAHEGYVCFVELKKPGFKPDPLQKIDHEKRRALGAHVYLVDSIENAERVVRLIKQEIRIIRLLKDEYNNRGEL